MRLLRISLVVLAAACAPEHDQPVGQLRQPAATMITTVISGRANEGLGASLDRCGTDLVAGSGDRAWASMGGFTASLTGGPKLTLCWQPDAGRPLAGQFLAANDSIFAGWAPPSWAQVSATPPIDAVARSAGNDVAVVRNGGLDVYAADGGRQLYAATPDFIDIVFAPRRSQLLWGVDTSNKAHLYNLTNSGIQKSIVLLGTTPLALEVGDFFPGVPGDEIAVMTTDGVDVYSEAVPLPLAPLVHHAVGPLDQAANLRASRFARVDTLLLGVPSLNRVYRLAGNDGYVLYQSVNSEGFGAAVVEEGNQLWVGAPKAGTSLEGRVALVTDAEQREAVGMDCSLDAGCDTTCGMGSCFGGVLCVLPIGTACMNGMPLDRDAGTIDAGLVDAGLIDSGVVINRDAGVDAGPGDQDAGPSDDGSTEQPDAGPVRDTGPFIFPVGCSTAPWPLLGLALAVIRRRGVR
ncbi:MAG: hypothetical protein U0228_28275 [Myxococcaceae bacterium]